MKKQQLVFQNENPSLHFARLAFHLPKKRLGSRVDRFGRSFRVSAGQRPSRPKIASLDLALSRSNLEDISRPAWWNEYQAPKAWACLDDFQRWPFKNYSGG
jgi:hypothetical protein